MKPFSCVMCAWIVLAATGLGLANEPSYALKAKAERTDARTLISATITRTTADGKTETLACPRMIVDEGQQAYMVVGSRKPDKNAGGDAGGDMESGLKLDVISVKGKDEVLIVSSAIEDGKVVWAQASTVRVEAKADNKAQSAKPGTGAAVTAVPAKRVILDWKLRHPAGQGQWAWEEGKTRILTGGQVPLGRETSGCAYKLTASKDGEVSIQGINCRIVPTDAADFDASRISAAESRFDTEGKLTHPISAGKVFNLRFGGDAPSDALIRIRSIEPAESPATRPREH